MHIVHGYVLYDNELRFEDSTGVELHNKITMAGMPCPPPPPKKKKKKKGKADLTILHIRKLPHLHMKLAVWFSFPTTNNKNQ